MGSHCVEDKTALQALERVMHKIQISNIVFPRIIEGSSTYITKHLTTQVPEYIAVMK